MDKVLFLAVILSLNIVTVYSGWVRIHGGDQETLEELEAKGVWTGFINFNNGEGTGDFETVKNWLTDYNKEADICPLWCRDPLAVKWRVKEQKYYKNSVTEIEACAVLYPEYFKALKPNGQTNSMKGFYCVNSYQKRGTSATCTNQFCLDNKLSFSATTRENLKCDKCPDFEVDYLCPDTVPRPTGKCPQEYERMLADIDDKMLMNRKELDEVEEVAARALEEKEVHADIVEQPEEKVDETYNELERTLMKYLRLNKQ